MSSYDELRQFVAYIAEEAQNNAVNLVGCAENVEKTSAVFSRITTSTHDNTAKTVEASFRIAQKHILIAANALIEASKAGCAWSGLSEPKLELVLKPRHR